MQSDNIITLVLLLLLGDCVFCRSTPDTAVNVPQNQVAVPAEGETVALPIIENARGGDPYPMPTATVNYINVWYASQVEDDVVFENGYWCDQAIFYNPTLPNTVYVAVCQEEFDDEPIVGVTQYSFDGQYFYPINDARFQTFRIPTPPGK